MSTELATQGELLLPVALVEEQPKFGSDLVHERMSGTGFLPRIQLMTAMSHPVARGNTRMGNYCLLKGKDAIVKDYGSTFNTLVICWRPKAMSFIAGKGKAFFNPNKAGFKDVESKADAKVKGHMYGPEYLIYLPDVDTIASMHFNNITMRMRAGEMKALLGQAATFKSEIIEKDGNIWPGPVIGRCAVPLEFPEPREEFLERVTEASQKFRNPPDEEVEEVEAAAVADGGRER